MTTDNRLDAIHYDIRELQTGIDEEVTRIVNALDGLHHAVYCIAIMLSVLLVAVVWPLIK
jgi:hypothetical protein